MTRPMSSLNRNNKNRYSGVGPANFLQKQREKIDKKKITCPAFPDCPKHPDANCKACRHCPYLKRGKRK